MENVNKFDEQGAQSFSMDTDGGVVLKKSPKDDSYHRLSQRSNLIEVSKFKLRDRSADADHSSDNVSAPSVQIKQEVTDDDEFEHVDESTESETSENDNVVLVRTSTACLKDKSENPLKPVEPSTPPEVCVQSLPEPIKNITEEKSFDINAVLQKVEYYEFVPAIDANEILSNVDYSTVKQICEEYKGIMKLQNFEGTGRYTIILKGKLAGQTLKINVNKWSHVEKILQTARSICCEDVEVSKEFRKTPVFGAMEYLFEKETPLENVSIDYIEINKTDTKQLTASFKLRPKRTSKSKMVKPYVLLDIQYTYTNHYTE